MKRPTQPARKAALSARKAALSGRKSALEASKSALGARKDALRQRQAQMRDRIEQRRAALSAAQPRKPRSRMLRRGLLLAGLLVLCLLQDCEEDDAPVPEATPAAAQPDPAGPGSEPPSPPPPPVSRRDRPAAPPVQAGPLPWLTSFQLQVSARSPRLTGCFEGATSPGLLKWSASVEPSSGQLSDQQVETLLGSAPLTRPQRDCVLEVMSAPAYDLGAAASRATPTRLSLVIEF